MVDNDKPYDGTIVSGPGRVGLYATTNYPDSIAFDYKPSPGVEVDGEQVDLSAFIKSVKEALGQSPVIIKCAHCGQWGARHCACRFCGAPVG